MVKIYWKVFKPETFGVKVIVENGGKFLWVKNDYGKRSITFPGGRIEKGESAISVASREIKEEVGLHIINLKFIGEIISTEEGKKDNISIFYAQSNTDSFVLDRFEIAEAGWFAKDNPPKFNNLAQKIWDTFLHNP